MAAAATVAGQNLGLAHPERAPRTFSMVGLFLAAPMALLFVFAPRALLGLFGMEDAGFLALGRELLAYLSLSAIFVTAALSYTGGLQGTGDTRSPFYISLLSQLVLPLGMCAVIDLVRGLEPSDIWLAIVLGHFSRCSCWSHASSRASGRTSRSRSGRLREPRCGWAQTANDEPQPQVPTALGLLNLNPVPAIPST